MPAGKRLDHRARVVGIVLEAKSTYELWRQGRGIEIREEIDRGVSYALGGVVEVRGDARYGVQGPISRSQSVMDPPFVRSPRSR